MPAPAVAGGVAAGAVALYRLYKAYKAYRKLQKLKKAKETAEKAKKAKETAEKAKKAREKLDKDNCKGSKKKCKSDKCPYCGRARHDTNYTRDRGQRRLALLRDASDPNSGLSKEARAFILETGGTRVPPGYEVSHEKPLYTVPPSERCKLDKAWNMKTQSKPLHRDGHKKCGTQYHEFGPP